MSELASAGQLRASLLRWTLFLVPGILLLGLLSAEMSGSGENNLWFAALNKPNLYPPPVTFAIVWTVLYVMMGLALALVVSAKGARGRAYAVAAFGLQFAFNLAWSPLFFAGHEIFGALLLLIAMDVLVALTILLFWRVRTAAGLLLVPYFAWILFATYLTWGFHVANPGVDGLQEMSYPATRVQF